MMRGMARLTRLQVTNYRSIGVGAEVILRPNIPVVLIGENNAGKPNLVRAINLILGARDPPGTCCRRALLAMRCPLLL